MGEAETARQKLGYVARLVALADFGSKREIRKQLLEMVGEVMDETSKEATVLRGLELATRLLGAADMAVQIEPVGKPDLQRFERAGRKLPELPAEGEPVQQPPAMGPRH